MPHPVEGIAVQNRFEIAHFSPVKNIHILEPSSRFYLCVQWGLLSWLRHWDPNSLVLEANPRILSSWLAVSWMRRRGRPVLGWGLGAPRTGSPLEMLVRKRFLGLLDGVIAYSQRGAQQYLSLGVKSVTVAYNAAAPRPDGPPPSRSGKKDGSLSLLFVGRLQPRKRLDLLLGACHDLPAGLQPDLVIVGDGPAREAFEAQAQALYPRTVFTGALHGKDLDPYFKGADLFVLPGTGGLAVQQAMASGLPVIVAQGDGTQDDLVRPGNGWQVPPDDQEAFRAVLLEALTDLSRLREMGAESYRIVQQEINLERMVDSFLIALGKAQPRKS
jgi:glycosyltransferase involved in cell wall biosynthesis